MKVALRTQQIIAEETNIPNVSDPLGGSYYVESLTNDMERAIWKIMEKTDEMGGAVGAIEQGYFQREIADAYELAQSKANNERTVVGVNKYNDEEEDQGRDAPARSRVGASSDRVPEARQGRAR